MDAALAMADGHGVWGGLDPEDRRDLGVIAVSGHQWVNEALAADRRVREQHRQEWVLSLGHHGYSAAAGA